MIRFPSCRGDHHAGKLNPPLTPSRRGADPRRRNANSQGAAGILPTVLFSDCRAGKSRQHSGVRGKPPLAFAHGTGTMNRLVLVLVLVPRRQTTQSSTRTSRTTRTKRRFTEKAPFSSSASHSPRNGVLRIDRRVLESGSREDTTRKPLARRLAFVAEGESIWLGRAIEREPRSQR